MSNVISFYDIASGPPVRCFAPNPWKTRYALNFKSVHGGIRYSTHWVDLTKVTEVRKSLGAAPNRKHTVDDSDFYTLPVIVDQSTGQTVGDTFDIALYLDKTYPGSEEGQPKLFPESTTALHRAFNSTADRVFTNYITLAVHTFPFNPETVEESKKEFCRRAGKKSWDELAVHGADRETMLKNFEAALDEIAKLYVRRDEGPFIEGRTPMYADLIVGAWLQTYKETLPEWDLMRTWHQGLWQGINDALEKYAQGL